MMSKTPLTYKEWTKEEEEFLKENYQHLTHKELIERLHRKLPSVLWKARALGLIKFKRTNFWTQEEVEILKFGYRKGSMAELEKRLRKSKQAIREKARKIGLTKRLNENCKCPNCGKDFVVKYGNQNFCSSKCRNSYKWKLIRKEWGKSGYLSAWSDTVVRSEKWVAEKVLPEDGFSNIIHVNERSGNFIFDIFAMKDGQKCAIQVTLYPHWTLKAELVPIVKFLGLRIFCCHVKPDFSKYVLNEIALPSHRTSSVSFVFS